jgi:hypothetical protein
VPSLRSSRARPLIGLLLAIVVIAVVLIIALGGSSSRRPRFLESVLQDDDHLVYASSATVSRTLDTLERLGVSRVRVTILWRAIAPSPGAITPPRGFDAANPKDYPASAWAPYDRLVKLAGARGIGVDFDLTAPGPLWAMARPTLDAKSADHYRPSAAKFGQFVTALGRRYNGSYVPPRSASPLPRVAYWSIWNEPNQPGWLAPQWQATSEGAVMEAPQLYRAYVDGAFDALRRTGHGPSTDTVLIGELAPEGQERTSATDPIPPMPFLRALYCVNASYRPLRGAAAVALGCPQRGDPSEFVRSHPGLFNPSGFAHHPYSFFLAPGVHLPDPNFVALADLSRLERGLDAIFGAYGLARRLPLYLTEYGYETNPPNPYRGVSPALQAQYLAQGQYMAWKDPRVRAFTQFLLYDALPDPRYPRGSLRYWSTFQTGLLYANGRPKPSFRAYRLPLFLPHPGGGVLGVWGMLRSARKATARQARVQWRSAQGSYRTLTTLTTRDPSGVLDTTVRLPGPGEVRIAWVSPSGQPLYSPAALVAR